MDDSVVRGVASVVGVRLRRAEHGSRLAPLAVCVNAHQKAEEAKVVAHRVGVGRCRRASREANGVAESPAQDEDHKPKVNSPVLMQSVQAFKTNYLRVLDLLRNLRNPRNKDYRGFVMPF